jgi:cell division septation protein DedD
MSARTLVTLVAIPLLVLCGCSREKSDWRSAQAADTSESYEQFISEHPDSSLVTDARQRLGQLVEEKDWRGAAAVDTPEAYQQFLKQHSSGKWAKEAQLRIDNFAAASVAGGSATPETVPVAPGEAAAVPESPAVGAGAGSGFGVQLGAFTSAERANAEWRKLMAEAPGTLDGLEPRVVVGEASGNTIYRLQAEVRDEAQARAICGGLKVANKPCVPVLPKH